MQPGSVVAVSGLTQGWGPLNRLGEVVWSVVSETFGSGEVVMIDGNLTPVHPFERFFGATPAVPCRCAGVCAVESAFRKANRATP